MARTATLMLVALAAAARAAEPAPPAPARPVCALPRVAAPAPSVSVGLDAHVHLSSLQNADPQAELSRLLGMGLFEKALIISPSYLVDHDGNRSLIPKGEPPDYDPVGLKRRVDAQSSAIVESAPDRLKGLCGLTRASISDESVQATIDCFDLPGMSGLKIRCASGDRLADAGLSSAITRVLDGARGRLRFVLLHGYSYEHARRDPTRPDYESWAEQDGAEIDRATELMARYPDVGFILAHSAFGPAMVERLAARARSLGLSNHFIDTSHILVAARDAPLYAGGPIDPELFDCLYAQSWKSLGLERVLFGSDIQSDSSASRFEAQKAAVANNAYLTAEEKEHILRRNGLVFWNALGEPRRQLGGAR